MSISLKSIFLCAALAAAFAPAFAADVSNVTPQQILQEQHDLRAKIDQSSGEYSRFDPSVIARVRKAQDQVFHMLDGVSSLAQLNEEQRNQLGNALDDIKATLAGHDGDRLICHRERKTGTNLVEKRCETVADREARVRASQEDMRQMDRSTQTVHGG